MTFTVEYLTCPAVITVTFSGPVTVSDRMAAMDDVIRRHLESGYRKVLVNIQSADLLEASHSESLDYAARLAREPAIRHLRIAYVGDSAKASTVETLAALRGFFYQRFQSPAAALRWL